jgi:hypothetical protein
MADLLDIAPTTACQAVKINGGMRFVVHGLNAPAIASIVSRFPELAVLLAGGGTNLGWHLIKHFGSAIGPIIAAGCGYLEDEEREKRVGNLLIEDQLKLIVAIIGLTFPNGLSPVIEAIMKLGLGAVGETKLIKVRLKKSPSPSPPSSDAASHPNLQ